VIKDKGRDSGRLPWGGVAHNPVRSPTSLFVDSTFSRSFLVTCPLTNPRMV